MEKKVFIDLSFKVIEATKKAIITDLYNNEMDSFDEFNSLVFMDFALFQSAYILADHIYWACDEIRLSDIQCLSTLQECIEWLSDGYTMYEGEENTTDLGKDKPFESEQQMNDYLNFLHNKIKSIG